MAMGARRSWVVGMVMRGALVQALIGLVLGAPVAYLGVHYIKSQLYDITTVNAGVLAAAIMILASAACVAGIIPARRAASIDPVRASGGVTGEASQPVSKSAGQLVGVSLSDFRNLWSSSESTAFSSRSGRFASVLRNCCSRRQRRICW